MSRNALDNSIRADMYRAMGAAVTNFKEQLPLPQSLLAQELLKENYDLGFIVLPEKYDESVSEADLRISLNIENLIVRIVIGSSDIIRKAVRSQCFCFVFVAIFHRLRVIPAFVSEHV